MSNNTTLIDKLLQTVEGRKAWHQERSIFETTEMLCDLMEREKISRSQLASCLGKTKGYITQLLDGSTNMQLRTISDAFLALGYAFHPKCSRITDETEGQILVENEMEPIEVAWSAQIEMESEAERPGWNTDYWRFEPQFTVATEFRG